MKIQEKMSIPVIFDVNDIYRWKNARIGKVYRTVGNIDDFFVIYVPGKW